MQLRYKPRLWSRAVVCRFGVEVCCRKPRTCPVEAFRCHVTAKCLSVRYEVAELLSRSWTLESLKETGLSLLSGGSVSCGGVQQKAEAAPAVCCTQREEVP